VRVLLRLPQGVLPALRTFNTLIIACNMCNQPREALAVYQELRESGFEANSTTFNALISAYGKLGQLDRVLDVYKDMVWKGLERSVITYSSLISACEKAGRWETALQLFDEMQRDGCSPNTVTYNSLITACGQGAALGQQQVVQLGVAAAAACGAKAAAGCVRYHWCFAQFMCTSCCLTQRAVCFTSHSHPSLREALQAWFAACFGIAADICCAF
jgi:pentatricopeptide repeat protein